MNGTVMPAREPLTQDAADSRVRSSVTTLLLIMLAVMIVRDILARRWGRPRSRSPAFTGAGLASGRTQARSWRDRLAADAATGRRARRARR